MPIVPFSSQPRSPLPGRTPPDEPWALMAAAQMHAEGRLIQAMDDGDFRRSPNVEDRRNAPPQPRPERDFGDNPARAASPLARDLAPTLAPR